MPHIFDRYYKGPNGHSGIGLAVAREAAERMGGSLSVTQETGSGAVFTLLLKKADDTEQV